MHSSRLNSIRLALFTSICLSSGSLLAQGTAFTYQGRLNDGSGPANGRYDFRFRLAGDPLANSYLANPYLTNAVAVSNGLFTAVLDFGPGLFTGSNLWLEVDVRTNGALSYTALTPLQALTPAPSAIFANTASNLSGTLPAGQLSGTLANATLPASPSFSGTVSASTFSGNGAGLANVNAATLGGFWPSNYWQVGGNTVSANQTLGSLNYQPINLMVGSRVLRLEPDPRGFGAGNLVAGYFGNAIQQPGSGGDVIAGGGGGGAPNTIYSNTSGIFIGAGSANQVGPNLNDAVIAGGAQNQVQGTADGSAISGGHHNLAANYNAAIGGGANNVVSGNAGTVSGGSENQASGDHASVAGGQGNTNSGDHAFIGGGNNNLVTNGIATISGGANNLASGYGATVSGGWANLAAGSYSGVAGGTGNVAANSAATVVGGENNTNYGDHAFIGGGYLSSIQPAAAAVIGGGYLNLVQTNAYEGTIAGGWTNVIGPNAQQATIGGGAFNTVLGIQATVAGGGANRASANFAAIPGGQNNVAAGQYSFAAGQQAQATNNGAFVWADSQNAVFTSTNNDSFNVRAQGGVRLVTGGAGLTINGQPVLTTGSSGLGLTVQQNANGAPNIIEGSPLNYVSTAVIGATISGGGATNFYGSPFSNSVTANFGTVSGGYNNQVSGYSGTIAGGYRNLASNNYSVVGGGENNQATGQLSVVAGGYNNQATGSAATVAGGYQDIASADYSGVAAGFFNTANASYAVVSGGYYNQASGSYSSIVGGDSNQAGGEGATVLGGYQNSASGVYSLAAGYQALATNDGAFVWADSQWAWFGSTTTNEFSIRAQNGVRIQADKGIHLNAADEPMLVRDWDVFATNAPAAKVGIGRWGLFMEPSVLTLGIPSNDVPGRYFQVAKYSTNGSPSMLMQVDQSGQVSASGGFRLNDKIMYLRGSGDLNHGLCYNGYAGGVTNFGTGNVQVDGPVLFGFTGGALAVVNGGAHAVLTWTNGGVQVNGGFSYSSDRNIKAGFTPLNSEQVLERVSALPISEWSYKTDQSAQHVGPMAQDFHAAFQLNGQDDTHINVGDEVGVALAAVQGLNQKLEATRAELSRRDAENQELRRSLDELKRLVQSLSAKLDHGAN